MTGNLLLLLALLSVPSTGPKAAPAVPPLSCGATRLGARVEARLRRPTRWRGRAARLDHALAEVARRAGLPLSMVLAAPLPEVRIPNTVLTPAALLGQLASASGAYAWRRRGGVVWFSYLPYRHDRQNFLNWRVHEMTLQGTVGRQLPILRELAAYGSRPSHTFIGEGVPAPAGPCKLPEETLSGLTVRALLERIMEAAPQFYSVVVFPRPRGLTRADALRAMSWWQWTWLAQPPPKPIPGISASNGE